MARRRPSSLPKLAAAIVPRYRARYQAKLDRYWPAFYRRIAPQVARAIAPLVVRTKADPDEMSLGKLVELRLRGVGWDAEARILTSSVEPIYLDLGDQAYRAVSADLSSVVSYDLNARELRAVQKEVGRRITEVTDTSRTRIASLVTDGLEKGLSVEQIVRGVKPGTTSVRGPIPAFPGIRGLVDSWSSTGQGARLGPGTGPTSSRSYLIALTETGNAFNKSAIAGYRDSGLVDFVEVFDGSECGWTSHDDPDKAHGKIVTLDEAADHPLSHPRCQRAFGAALAATGPSAAPGGAPKPPAPAPTPPPAPKPTRARKPTAAKDPADAFDVFADPTVAKADAAFVRAQTAYRNAKPGQGGRLGATMQAASIARDAAVREALAKAKARALAVSEAEARTAVSAVERRLAELRAERVRLQASYSIDNIYASQRIASRIDLLEGQLPILRRALPLNDRLTAKRPRSGATRDLYDDARRLVEAIEAELKAFDLRTVWTGSVARSAPRGAAGVFNWDQSIGIAPSVATFYKAEDRLKVIMHEVFHSVSPALNQRDFVAVGRGWEEGVVEGTTQWAEARIRAKLGLPPATGYKTYERYVDELDGMRRFLGRSPDDFWPELMRTPIAERKALIEKWVAESGNATLDVFVEDLDRKLKR